MKKIIIIIFSIFFSCLAVKAQSLYFNWAKQAGNAGNDAGFSIVLDKLGNSYSIGQFEGTVDFDPGAGIANLTSNGGSDIFITKLDAAGNFIWVKQIGGNSEDYGYSMTIDASGNICYTGGFSSVVDFDPGSEILNLTSKGGTDIFISKLTPSGNLIWAKQIGGSGSDISQDIVIDIYGNILTTGEFSKIADFDPGKDTFNLTNQIAIGLFVSKLDSLGNFIWAKKIEGNDWNQSLSIAVDLLGNIYFTGEFAGTVDFNPSQSVFNLNSFGGWDVFICKLNSSGNFVWAKQLGGKEYEMATKITIDKYSNVYSTGYFMGKADFDPDPVKTNFLLAKPTIKAVFISKLDSLGSFVWCRQLGGNFDTDGYALMNDDLGNIYVGGEFVGKTDFDLGTDTFYLNPPDGYGAFVLKLDAAGKFIWAESFNSYANLGINDIALDAFGNVYSTGYFNEKADFDPDAVSFNLTSNGGLDIFIHKLGINPLKINPFEDESFFVIYPNPNNGSAIISFEKTTKKGSIKIINCFGQIVFSQNDVSESNYEINISDKPNGIYFIELINDNNTLRAKLIKD